MKTIETEYDDLIEYAEDNYADHEGVRRATIVRWLAQFSKKSRPVAAKSLEVLTYFSTSNIRKMTSELVDCVYQEYPSVSKKHIYFVPIGGAGAGSQVIARVLRGIAKVPAGCVVTMLDVEGIAAEQMKVVVLVEDFSGTGKQIDEWWPVVEGIFLPKNADIVLGLLVINYRARTRLAPVFKRILAVADLERQHDVFDAKCTKFSRAEKNALLAACRSTGCSSRFLKGFGDSGLLVVFKHGCPNNSLPILWYSQGAWHNLFQRQGI